MFIRNCVQYSDSCAKRKEGKPPLMRSGGLKYFHVRPVTAPAKASAAIRANSSVSTAHAEPLPDEERQEETCKEDQVLACAEPFTQT